MKQSSQEKLIVIVLSLLTLAVVVLVVVVSMQSWATNTREYTAPTITYVPFVEHTLTPSSTPRVSDTVNTSAIVMNSPGPVSTESVPPAGAPYINVNNINEQTGLPVISSPKLGETYSFKDIIRIRWNPELIDASDVQLYNVKDPSRGMVLNWQQRPVGSRGLDGVLDYQIPDNLTVYPGQYVLKVFDAGAGNVYTSDIFTIDSTAPLLQRESEMYRIGSIYGAKDNYSVGDTMSLNIEAFDGNGTFADSSKGFNVQARLYETNDNVGVWTDNATYSADAHIWHINVPVKANTYRVNIILYCSLQTLASVCGQEYGYDKQVEHFINFMVK